MTHVDMQQLSVTPRAQVLVNLVARAKRTFAPPRSKLRRKLITMLILTMLIGIALSSFLVLSLHRQDYINQAQADAEHVGIIIEASLFHSMSNPDLDMLKDMISAETSQAGLTFIRILDKEGTIWASSNSTEVGQIFRRNESPCSDCHSSGTNAAPKAPAFESKIVGEDLVTVNLIENEPSCYACHNSSAHHLGLLMVATPIASLQAQLTESSWWLFFSGLISFVLLVGLLTPALEKFVTRPIVDLSNCAAEIGAGNLDRACQVKSDDELGELAATFDRMRLRLKTMLEEKEQQNQDLRMLNDIARITSEQLEPQQILDLTIKQLVNMLKVEAAAIRVLTHERGQFTLHGCHGIPYCIPKTCELRTINIELTNLPSSDQPPEFESKADEEGRTYIGIPLQAKGVLVGGLALITHPGQSVTPKGTRILQAMGQQIGLAVLNAIHYQQARSQATLEERDRLAREMHDSLAQALSYLKMKASVTDELLSGGLIDEAQLNLREVKEIAKETYFDVRETIFGLRNATSTASQFIPGLEEYLDKYRLHYGVQVDVFAEENCQPTFPAEVTLQLMRIIQEALTNARKHSLCNEACIRFARDERQWRITIEDRGAGFDPLATQSEGWRFLGLHIMQERAASIGAELQVDSKPGVGTRVTIRVPFGSES